MIFSLLLRPPPRGEHRTAAIIATVARRHQTGSGEFAGRGRAPEPQASHGCKRQAAIARPHAAAIVMRSNRREDRMPEIVVYALGGRSLDQKRGLMKDITDAVVKNYAVPAEAVVVTLVETEKQAKMKGGVLFSEMGQR